MMNNCFQLMLYLPDIAGILGLWLGCSFLTILENFELVADLIYVAILKILYRKEIAKMKSEQEKKKSISKDCEKSEQESSSRPSTKSSASTTGSRRMVLAPQDIQLIDRAHRLSDGLTLIQRPGMQPKLKAMLMVKKKKLPGNHSH